MAEKIPPSHSSGTGPVDTTAPYLDMSLSTIAGSVVVDLISHDETTLSPVIRYTVNDGVVQTYQAPLSFVSGEGIVLKSFAEDGMGNTSGLITTSVRPSLSIQNQAATTIVLEWPVADAYVLDEADSLLGPWSRSSAQITRDALTESATVPIGTAVQKFFRLRSQTVTK